MTPDDVVYVTHDEPVWRPRQSYMAMVDLAVFDLAGQREQLWLKSIGSDEYELCCIPFCAYGLALGDVVSIDSHGHVTSVLRKSGRRVLRLLLQASPAASAHLSEITSRLRMDGLLFEVRGNRHIAIDFPAEDVQWSAGSVVQELVQRGDAFSEWADVLSFRPAGEQE